MSTYQERLRAFAEAPFNEDGSFVFSGWSPLTEGCPARFGFYCALQEGPRQSDCESCDADDCEYGREPRDGGCRMFWECGYVGDAETTATCPLLLEFLAMLLREAGVTIPDVSELAG